MSFRPALISPFTMASPAVMSPTLSRTMSGLEAGNGMASMQSLINSTAGDYSSIYQSCIRLKKRLAYVPGMAEYLRDMEIEEQESPDDSDIVTSLWNMLRRGQPLIVLYNAFGRAQLAVPPNTHESKVGKSATFKFLTACMRDLKIPASEVFIITDLYGRDTTGFLKVIKVVDVVIQMLKDRGLLDETSQVDELDEKASPTNNHEHVINELLTTERNYISHLDTLQQFKNACIQGEMIIGGDLVHEIFMNLNALVDYQRRFLIRLEQQNALEPQVQNWGKLFEQYADGFKIYEPFVANTAKANHKIEENWEKIRMLPMPAHLQGLVGADNRGLTGFMLKPLQRITKYPLLLGQLIKDPTYDASKKADLIEGKAAIEAICTICNNATARAERAGEVYELIDRVEDWKGHKWDRFGELIISGTHTVLKDDVSKANKEREYQIYLFEQILFCCKEINQNKAKIKLGGRQNTDDKAKKTRLQLKGRIFVQNVTNVIKFQDNKIAPSKPFHLQIFWRGDPSIENFQICFAAPAQRDEWFDKVLDQVKKFSKVTGDAVSSGGTSATDFISLRNETLTNPYMEADDGEEEEDAIRLSSSSTLVNPEYPHSRNGSTPSLRSRSTTGGSGPPMNANLPGRNVAPLRFPMDSAPPLKLSTSFTMATAVATPDPMYGGSYFSPTERDSPSSMRSSQSGTITPMTAGLVPRGGFPPSMRPMDNKHQTAPPGTYLDRRSQQRVGEQAQYNAHMAAQQRSRSLSSPDIQNQSPGKRSMNGSLHEDVPVPPIPHHVLPLGHGRPTINRSQTGSPTEAVRLGRPPHGPHAYTQDPYIRTDSRQGMGQHGVGQRLWSPAPSMSMDSGMPTQIKVRIAYAKNYVTIVVPANIRFQTLVDRIDAKMVKHSCCSITSGSAKLRWLDEGTFVSLGDDDDIQMVLDEWRDSQLDAQAEGRPPPDLELEWHEGDDIRNKLHG